MVIVGSQGGLIVEAIVVELYTTQRIRLCRCMSKIHIKGSRRGEYRCGEVGLAEGGQESRLEANIIELLSRPSQG